MLVVDFYRGILEEYHILTSYLREQSVARGLDRPMFGQGRLWRICSQGGARCPQRAGARDRRPGKSSQPHELVRWLAPGKFILARGGAAGIGWSGGTGRRSRPWRIWRCTPRSRTPAWPRCGRWTECRRLRPELLGGALRDPAAPVRQAAVRLHERFLGGARPPRLSPSYGEAGAGALALRNRRRCARSNR